MNVLVDTSVWSLGFGRKGAQRNPHEQQVVLELKELVREGRAFMIGLVRQELLSGIRNKEQFERLKTKLREFPDLSTEMVDHEAAAKASNECRARGIVVSVVDILLFAVASRHGMLIFSTDPDFASYARVLPLKLHLPRDFTAEAD
jgi:predicted nucleic acid-binding protein